MTHHSAADDARVTELALRAGRGDRAALTEFIKATQDDVWRLLAHLGGPEIADDLTQETYLRVLGAEPVEYGAGLLERLRAEQVVCIQRGAGIRFSPHFYTSEAVIEETLGLIGVLAGQ